MQKYYPSIQKSPLFQGFSYSETARLLQLLDGRLKRYAKGETLLLSGYESRQIGILLTGEAEAQKLTGSGGVFTVARLASGGAYGNVLSGSSAKSPVTVLARTACNVLLIEYSRLFHPPAGEEPLYFLLLGNLMRTASEKYFQLDKRIDLLLLQGPRKKLCAWLLDHMQQDGTVPCCQTRTALAQYFGCDRSALSREISRMVKENLLCLDTAGFFVPEPDALHKILLL